MSITLLEEAGLGVELGLDENACRENGTCCKEGFSKSNEKQELDGEGDAEEKLEVLSNALDFLWTELHIAFHLLQSSPTETQS